MTIRFPYDDVPPLELDADAEVDFYDLPFRSGKDRPMHNTAAIVCDALQNPIGTSAIADLARGKESILVVVDDNSRPTPVSRFVHCVLQEIHAAGISEQQITFMMALGTHRPMTRKEMVDKLGEQVVRTYTCINHDWENPDVLEYLGDTAQGAPVWINRKVAESDLVIGVGAIMPIDICGYTGGGKILVPGLSGPETVNKMHWTRVSLPKSEVVGHADNPIRESIDALARKAGLDFIVNVVLDANGNVVDAVAGDLEKAHREGCRRAAGHSNVSFAKEYDIVIADSHPFDIEFWQANKALDTAGHFVRPGGVIILVTPCHEGWSQTHREEILRFGYLPTADIKKLVEEGKIKHSVVGVHMHQVSEAAVEKGRLILVTAGLPRDEVERVGFEWSATPHDAFSRAAQAIGDKPTVAALSNAARMIPVQHARSDSP